MTYTVRVTCYECGCDFHPVMHVDTMMYSPACPGCGTDVPVTVCWADASQVAKDKRSVPFPAFVSYLFPSFKARINNKSRGVGRQ